jgi:hypothetical protein
MAVVIVAAVVKGSIHRHSCQYYNETICDYACYSILVCSALCLLFYAAKQI